MRLSEFFLLLAVKKDFLCHTDFTYVTNKIRQKIHKYSIIGHVEVMKIKLRGGVSLAEQINFYRQLAVILRSGLSLLNALQLLQSMAMQSRCCSAIVCSKGCAVAAAWHRPWQRKRIAVLSWQLLWWLWGKKAVSWARCWSSWQIITAASLSCGVLCRGL